MKKLLLFLSLLFLTGCPGGGGGPDDGDMGGIKTNLGLDYLGLAMMDCDTVIAAHPVGWSGGSLANTFGDDKPCIRRLLQSKKLDGASWREQLSNGPGHRNNRLEAHDKFNPTDSTFLANRAKAYGDLLREFPKVKCLLSPVLEHDIKDAAAVKRNLDAVEKAAPNCQVVNSTVSGARFNDPAIIDERHGESPDVWNNGIISSDGKDIVNFSDVPAYVEKYKNARIVFLWAARFNLLQACKDKNGKPIFIPPSKRKAKPSREYIEGVIRMVKREKCPNSSLLVTPITKPKNLYKVYSEDSGCGGDQGGRNNRPLAILQNKGKEVSVLTYKGQLLGRFVYYGTYEKSYRYYSNYSKDGLSGIGLYGYQIGEKAKALSGSSCVGFRDSQGRIWGLVDPVHRVE